MTKFILHGGFTRVDNELNRSFFRELVKDVPSGGTVLLVYFARKNDEIEVRFKQDKELIQNQTNNKSFNFVLATNDSFINQVKESNVIFISGGDTDKLLTTLKEYSDFKEAIKYKTVAGSSAGAYVFSTFYFSNSRNENFKGLGILPIRIICHYQSTNPMFNKKNDPIELMENCPDNLELVILKDYEWVVKSI